MSDRGIKLQALLRGMADPGAHGALAPTGLALDSRHVRPGDAFLAVRGASGHGMSWAARARACGAIVVIHDGRAEVPENLGLPEVLVPGLADELPRLAQRFWGEAVADLDLVAVTGTNGKSSVAWLLAQALDGAMIGTLGCGRPGQLRPGTHTTPDILSVYRELAALQEEGCERVVLEASSHALDQRRLEGLAFTSVVFTTLGHDHLDYHRSRAAYAAAKTRLFTEFPSKRQLINLDDDFGIELVSKLPAGDSLIGYSLHEHEQAQVTAKLVSADADGLEADVRLGDGELHLRAPLIGQVNLWNVLIVVAELHARGFDDQAIISLVGSLRPVPGRMEPVRAAGRALAIVDYAHSPDALENALLSSRELAAESLWCVFGCGGDRDREKRPRMGRVAERLADRIVLTDDNPRHEDGLSIIRAIQAGMAQPRRCRVIRDRARAIAYALSEAAEGDVVLIAGKGHETEQVVGDRSLPFDDRRCVRRALEVAA